MGWFDQLQTFMPHGMCLLWRPELLFLHVASDALIAAAYFAIPFAIAAFVRGRADLEPRHRAIAILFAAFIALCGLTHLASILVLWYPVYVTEGWLKAATAAVSVATAGLVLVMIPHLLRLPSARALQREIDDHRATLVELSVARTALALKFDLTQSELRQSEQNFAQSDTMLRAVIETVPGMIYAKERSGRLMLANKSTLDLIGKPWAAVQGHTDAEFLGDARQARTIMQNDALVMELGRQEEIEEVVDHPTKGRRILLSTKLPLHDAAGAVTGLVGISLDITDRKHLEAKINQVARVSAMGDMATALAHELNQPLGAIIVYLDGMRATLEQTSPAHPALQPLDLARNQCIRAGEIIRHLRAFVSGGDRIRHRENLSRLVDDACVLALLGAGESDIETRIEHASPDTYAVVDKVEIEQVVVNLVRNALESMPLRGDNLLVVRTGQDANRNAVISVEDTGCGLTPEVRDGLFQPFKSTKGTKGMGIGLSLCRTIVEAHGGTIGGRPNARVGSTFAFTLPATAHGATS